VRSVVRLYPGPSLQLIAPLEVHTLSGAFVCSFSGVLSVVKNRLPVGEAGVPRMPSAAAARSAAGIPSSTSARSFREARKRRAWEHRQAPCPLSGGKSSRMAIPAATNPSRRISGPVGASSKGSEAACTLPSALGRQHGTDQRADSAFLPPPNGMFATLSAATGRSPSRSPSR
jgi:hypothetical protein